MTITRAIGSIDASNALNQLKPTAMKDLTASDNIIDWVSAFVADDHFQGIVMTFCDQHASKFLDVSNSEEHRAEWTQYHHDFLQLTECEIEEFLVSKEYTLEQLKQKCAEVPIDATSKQAAFMKLLIACTKYDHFVKLMQRMASPTIQYREDLILEAEKIKSQAEDRLQEGTLDADKSQHILKATTRLLIFLENYPNATQEEMEKEEAFLMSTL